MIIQADLHIHSCLSPCGSLDMSPKVIVSEAVRQGMSLIAITDHNSALNCQALEAICRERDDIRCFFGMEITSIEEVHLLCLTDSLSTITEFSEWIYGHLPNIDNDPEMFGDQVYVDAEENILGEAEKYLGNAVDLSIDRIRDEIKSRNMLFIPAHIDRDVFSMTSQLGFLPVDDYDAVEISRYHFRDKKRIPNLHKYPAISDSDAHFPEDIGCCFNRFEFDGKLIDFGIGDLKAIFASGKNEIWNREGRLK